MFQEILKGTGQIERQLFASLRLYLGFIVFSLVISAFTSLPREKFGGIQSDSSIFFTLKWTGHIETLTIVRYGVYRTY